MNVRLWNILIGAAVAAICTALTILSVTLLGPLLGGGVSFAVSAIAGAAAVWLCVHAFERRIIELLSSSDAVHDFDSVALGEVSELIGSMKQSLSQLRRIQIENEEIERLARASCASISGEGAVGAKANTKQCVIGLLDQLRQTTALLFRYTSALEDANERVASGALDQSETVARTTSTVEGLSDKIDRISQNAENANEACERTRQEARQGLEQVHRVIQGMDRLRLQIESNGRKARRLGDRSVEIGTIVELIRGISSRTDTLALNATIESVRAGEHGRGFAVVAEEIRKLAERTAAATNEINTLVEAIQADAHESLRALGEEQGEMEKEVQRVRETGAALERISKVAEHSAQLVEGISRSSNDQVLAAQEMVRAIQRISEVSHLTLEGTTQSRESLRGISQCCERLQPLSAVTGALPVSNHGESPAPLGLSSSRRKRALATSE